MFPRYIHSRSTRQSFPRVDPDPQCILKSQWNLWYVLHHNFQLHFLFLLHWSGSRPLSDRFRPLIVHTPESLASRTRDKTSRLFSGRTQNIHKLVTVDSNKI